MADTAPLPPTQNPERPSAARAPNLNTEKLRALVEAVEQLKTEVRENKEAAEKREAVLYAEIKLLKAQQAQANAQFKELHGILDIGDEGDEAEGDAQEDAEDAEEITATAEQVQRSVEAAKGKMLKVRCLRCRGMTSQLCVTDQPETFTDCCERSLQEASRCLGAPEECAA